MTPVPDSDALAWLAASELEVEPGPLGEPAGAASLHRLTDESLRSLRAELKPPPLLGRLGTACEQLEEHQLKDAEKMDNSCG